jgi:hypothetical protein
VVSTQHTYTLCRSVATLCGWRRTPPPDPLTPPRRSFRSAELPVTYARHWRAFLLVSPYCRTSSTRETQDMAPSTLTQDNRGSLSSSQLRSSSSSVWVKHSLISQNILRHTREEKKALRSTVSGSGRFSSSSVLGTTSSSLRDPCIVSCVVRDPPFVRSARRVKWVLFSLSQRSLDVITPEV